MVPQTVTRNHILDSAQDLIVRDGVGCLTLDRVAREAGISKGGLLYHFGCKEDLIRELISRLILHFEEDWAAWEFQSTDEPGSKTRAFVNATLQGTWDTKVGLRPHSVGLFTAMMAALANKPDLLNTLRERYQSWQKTLEADGIDPTQATLARLAADGLWFSELLGFAPPSPDRRKAIIGEILALAGGK